MISYDHLWCSRDWGLLKLLQLLRILELRNWPRNLRLLHWKRRRIKLLLLLDYRRRLRSNCWLRSGWWRRKLLRLLHRGRWRSKLLRLLHRGWLLRRCKLLRRSKLLHERLLRLLLLRWSKLLHYRLLLRGRKLLRGRCKLLRLLLRLKSLRLRSKLLLW